LINETNVKYEVTPSY